MRLSILASLAMAVALPAHAAPVSDKQAVAMAKPQILIVSPDLTPAARRALLRPVDQFYGFWINGSAKLLAASISPDFIDHTLPAGRPQGPTGPAIASQGFLSAVPDSRWPSPARTDAHAADHPRCAHPAGGGADTRRA